MLSLLICALSITFCMYSMEQKDSKYLTSLFTHLFPAKEETKPLKQKISLPLKKITITKEMIPLLEVSSRTPSLKGQNKINFVISGLAEKQNLKVIPTALTILDKPQTGKSTLALSIAYRMQQKALEQKSKWSIYRLTKLANQYQNSGPQNLKAIAEKFLTREKGTILIADDISECFLNFKSGASDSRSNVTAFWKLLDLIQDNSNKNFLLLITETSTAMPTQLKERLLPTMIPLQPLDWTKIHAYLVFKLKEQQRVCFPCNHAPQSCENSYAQTETVSLGLVDNCEECKNASLHKCVVGLTGIPDISYGMLERFIDQAIRFSFAQAFKERKPYVFLLQSLFLAVSKAEEGDEYDLLKMKERYKSEQEQLHEKQLEQQKKFHEEQQGLALLQSQYGYRQTMQQLIFSTALDNGGMPGTIEAKPQELLDSTQQQLYENTFVKNIPNKTPLFPDELSSTKNNEIMQKTLQKLKKLHHEESKK